MQQCKAAKKETRQSKDFKQLLDAAKELNIRELKRVHDAIVEIKKKK